MRQISELTLTAINAEAIRAHARHGQQSMFYGDDAKGLRILVEEVGEIAREMNELALGNRTQSEYHDNLEKELIQTAAMCATWLERLNQFSYLEREK